MITQSYGVNIENPRGYEVESSVLQEFELGLDPLDPASSRIPCRVLGYGEISTVFEIKVEGLHDLAFKRMCCFETMDELKPYLDTYLLYNQVLENQVGLHLPPYGYAVFVNERGRPICYIIQKRLLPASIGNNALQLLPSQEILSLFKLALLELHKVWVFNRSHTRCQVGIDGQISNWSIQGFDPHHPFLSPNVDLIYIDTSTPFVRLNGVEQLDTELFLRSAPPYLTWILRLLFLQDVLNRYYNPRKVTIDLIANFYKERRPELIPELVAVANDYFKEDGIDLDAAEINEKQVRDYYRQDQVIWRLYLGMRRFDRFVRKKMLRLEYPYILPGQIKR
jgi:hypothetical protein